MVISKALDPVDRQLLNLAQSYTPLTERPFQELADQLDLSESEVLERLQSLDDAGIVSRYGAIFHHQRAGASTLVAMQVPEALMGSVVTYINKSKWINHNYMREHCYNLWFVAAAPDREIIDDLLQELESAFRLPLLDLPMEKSFFIDLGFPV